MKAYVLLEDGERFDGKAVGARAAVTGEVVFTTGMSGYQESMTDPSFARQLITFTTAHVGNYGVSAEAWESDQIHAAGAIMREATNTDDAPGAEQGWLDWLAENGIPGIAGVDTRALVRHIRSAGAMRGGIFPASMPEADAHDLVSLEPSMVGRDLAREVTLDEPRTYGDGSLRIVALDTGIKRSIVDNFVKRGVQLELYPCTTPADELLARDPDGFFLVPGPATRRRSTTWSTRSARCSSASRSSGSASATSCSRAGGRAWRPSSSRSAIGAPTTRSRTCDRADRHHLAEPRLRGGG